MEVGGRGAEPELVEPAPARWTREVFGRLLLADSASFRRVAAISLAVAAAPTEPSRSVVTTAPSMSIMNP